MYNRYINTQGDDDFQFTPVENTPPSDQEEQSTGGEQNGKKQGGILSNLKNMFGGENGLAFDLDTVFLLVLVYFLISDGEENSTEVLLIVAGLLLFGF